MDYSSARMVSKGSGSLLYGRIEVKAKLPSGTGTWPAIWTLPNDYVYVAEPPVDKNWSFETTPAWADEFDYTGSPDSTKWTYDLGGGGWGNSELEYYTK